MTKGKNTDGWGLACYGSQLWCLGIWDGGTVRPNFFVLIIIFSGKLPSGFHFLSVAVGQADGRIPYEHNSMRHAHVFDD